MKLTAPQPETLTHADLVARGCRWLRGTAGCDVVLADTGCWAVAERPDCYGIGTEGSYVVECKTSVADFVRDKHKPFRTQAHAGLGRFRYMLTPRGLITPDHHAFPEGWGLIEIRGAIIRVIQHSIAHPQNAVAEVQFLRSAISWGKFAKAVPA